MKLTYPEWERYAVELKAHELRMQAKEPKREYYPVPPHYFKALHDWEQEFFMTAPNKPGYERANND